MLTRLKVNGFKNLVDVDVRFGPFTCIAGVNGVGKSNLFDAIRFLSALADRPLVDAALSVRDEGVRAADIRSLFHRVDDQYVEEMSFETEMIIPPSGVDDLGQTAKASITFLRYSLTIAYKSNDDLRSSGSLEIVRENLEHINIGDATPKKSLRFEHTPEWKKSVVTGRRTSPFISTEERKGERIINLHQDGGSSGRPQPRLAQNLPRTVLSATNAAESPTALLARREMQSWRLLQLEPSALRKSDEFTAPTTLNDNGANLASTLYHLARSNISSSTGKFDEMQIYTTVANALSGLINDVDAVWIDRDDKRELLTLYLKERNGTSHAARALSDGTLRFLALAVLQLDTHSHGLICLEEPENGIHPDRIPAILELLQNIATDVDYPIDEENPLRQVIINTHSPLVVQKVPDDSLIVAELVPTLRDGARFSRVQFSPLPETWRATEEGTVTVEKGQLLAYLNPGGHSDNTPEYPNGKKKMQRVIDRHDLQLLLPGFAKTHYE